MVETQWCSIGCKISNFIASHRGTFDAVGASLFVLFLGSLMIDDSPIQVVAFDVNPNPVPAKYYPTILEYTNIISEYKNEPNVKTDCSYKDRILLYAGNHSNICTTTTNNPEIFTIRNYDFQIHIQKQVFSQCIDQYILDLTPQDVSEELLDLPLFGPSYQQTLLTDLEKDLEFQSEQRNKDQTIKIASTIILFFNNNHLGANSQLINQFRIDEHHEADRSALNCALEIHSSPALKSKHWSSVAKAEDYYLLDQHEMSIKIINEELIDRYDDVLLEDLIPDEKNVLSNGLIVRGNSYYHLFLLNHIGNDLLLAEQSYTDANTLVTKPDGLLGLSFIYNLNDEREKAIDVLNKALALDNTRVDIHKSLIDTYEKTNQYEEKENHLQELKSTLPSVYEEVLKD